MATLERRDASCTTSSGAGPLPPRAPSDLCRLAAQADTSAAHHCRPARGVGTSGMIGPNDGAFARSEDHGASSRKPRGGLSRNLRGLYAFHSEAELEPVRWGIISTALIG